MIVLDDGRQAAVWDGLAFPLLDGGRIDVAGEGFPLPSPAPSVPSLHAWALVEIEDAAHVLLQGSSTSCEETANDLKREGLPVLRWGRYFGEPTQGFVADWFIRIARSPSMPDPRPIVAQLLGMAASPEPHVEKPLRERLLASELEAVRMHNLAQRQEVERLREELERHRHTESDLPMLRRLADEERALRIAAEQQLGQLMAWNAEQARAIPSRRLEEREAGRSPPKVAREIEDFLATMFPRMGLLRDSLAVIVTEFPHRRGVYKALDELQRTEQGIPSNWKMLKGLRDWWERHVSTGHDDSGRIYARLDLSDRKWRILIGHKVEQERDLAWLARN